MSIRIEEFHYKRIFRPNGDSIFDFPPNTLLDRILSDLWPIIIQYIEKINTQFYIGKYDTVYEKYRLISQSECMLNIFKHNFKNYYVKTGGLMSLDDIDDLEHGYLCCNGYYLDIDGIIINSDTINVRKYELLRFHDPLITSNNMLRKRLLRINALKKITNDSDKVGLFVKL